MPGEACSHRYLSCNDGFAMEMACAASLKFDIETGLKAPFSGGLKRRERPLGTCLGSVYVRACGGSPTPPPQPAADIPQAPVDPSYNCNGTHPPVGSLMELGLVVGLEDGDYAHPREQCSFKYYRLHYQTAGTKQES